MGASFQIRLVPSDMPPPYPHRLIVPRFEQLIPALEAPERVKYAHTLVVGRDDEAAQTDHRLRGKGYGRSFGSHLSSPWRGVPEELRVMRLNGKVLMWTQEFPYRRASATRWAEEILIALYTVIDIEALVVERSILGVLDAAREEGPWRPFAEKVGRKGELSETAKLLLGLIRQEPLLPPAELSVDGPAATAEVQPAEVPAT